MSARAFCLANCDGRPLLALREPSRLAFRLDQEVPPAPPERGLGVASVRSLGARNGRAASGRAALRRRRAAGDQSPPSGSAARSEPPARVWIAVSSGGKAI